MCLVPHGVSRLHHWRKMTTKRQPVIQHHCIVTGEMVEAIGLLIVQPGNVICVVDTAMKREIVNPVYQGQEVISRMVTLCDEIRLVLDA